MLRMRLLVKPNMVRPDTFGFTLSPCRLFSAVFACSHGCVGVDPRYSYGGSVSARTTNSGPGRISLTWRTFWL
eukprot:571170-Rhodomonas_salina.1